MSNLLPIGAALLAIVAVVVIIRKKTQGECSP